MQIYTTDFCYGLFAIICVYNALLLSTFIRHMMISLPRFLLRSDEVSISDDDGHRGFLRDIRTAYKIQRCFVEELNLSYRGIA